MIQIRTGIFETNSSSIHSLTVCPLAEYKLWQNGELLFLNNWKESRLVTYEEAEEIIKKSRMAYAPDTVNDPIDHNDYRDEDLYSFNDYLHYGIGNCEGFSESYTTNGGEKLMIFGYFGYDG